MATATKKKVAMFYDKDVGNFYYGQVRVAVKHFCECYVQAPRQLAGIG